MENNGAAVPAVGEMGSGIDPEVFPASPLSSGLSTWPPLSELCLLCYYHCSTLLGCAIPKASWLCVCVCVCVCVC